MSQPTDPTQKPLASDASAPPAPSWAQNDPTLPSDAPVPAIPDDSAADADLGAVPPAPTLNSAFPSTDTATPASDPSYPTADIPGISPPFDIGVDTSSTDAGLPPAPGLEDPNLPPTRTADFGGLPPAPSFEDPSFPPVSGADPTGLPPLPSADAAGLGGPSGFEDPNLPPAEAADFGGLPPAPGTEPTPDAGIPPVPAMDPVPTPDAAAPAVSDASGTVPPPPFATDQEQKPAASSDLSGVTMDGKKKPPIKMILIIVLALVLLVSGIMVVMNFFSSGSDSSSADNGSNTKKPAKEVELTYWGLWELNNTMEEVIHDFEADHPGVTITYKKQSHKDYRERLQSEIKAGTGPDIFRYHNTWLPMVINNLSPAPEGTVDMTEYFDVIQDDVQVNGNVYGVPLMFDALALYYNPKMLTNANVSVPTTWEALRSASQKLKVTSNSNGELQQAGVAMGTVNNVEHFPDILGLLLLQNGADPAKPDECSATNNPKLGRPDCWGQDAFLFYDIFRSESIWNDTLPSSTYAFATEQVAMMFAPSWRAFEVAEINPDLEFMTAPVPQLTDDKVAWATYWVEGVSKESKDPDLAWEFLAYMSQDDVLKKLYTAQSQVRMFGEIYPKTALAAELKNDDVIGAFVEQAEYAQSWYMSSYTHDNGINDQIIKYYEDAMTEIADNGKPSEVLPTVTSGVKQVFSKYGLSTK